MPATVGDLYLEISAVLNRAFNDDKITPMAAQLLRRKEPDRRGMVEIAGGVPDQRLTGKNQFERQDGALFNFEMLLETNGANQSIVEINSYRFHIQFPDGEVPQLIRFDLNPPGHTNDARAIRCHVHPGVNDESIFVPSPLLAPSEILDFLIDELPLGKGRRRAR